MDVAAGYHREKQRKRRQNVGRHLAEDAQWPKSLVPEDPGPLKPHPGRAELHRRAQERWPDLDDWVVVKSSSKAKFELVNVGRSRDERPASARRKMKKTKKTKKKKKVQGTPMPTTATVTKRKRRRTKKKTTSKTKSNMSQVFQHIEERFGASKRALRERLAEHVRAEAVVQTATDAHVPADDALEQLLERIEVDLEDLKRMCD